MLLLLFTQERGEVSDISLTRKENKHVTIMLFGLTLMLFYFF